jgi:hypothetical protein
MEEQIIGLLKEAEAGRRVKRSSVRERVGGASVDPGQVLHF